ncbi:MAG: type I DNA topoisomerase [Proteobacteria bacterium]|nr:type I DNA topoisomerase [Pseudomonadota bacterium]
MAKSLVIVESPAKARTIRKYLGASFIVKASLGHVKDLPKSKMGVAVDKDFTPEYKIIPGKKKILSDLIKSAEQVENIYLALDPDREGEAIAWHIAEEIGINPERVRRVLFNEITKKGIKEGLSNPLPLNTRRYESQQARRILDRLVGYEISPILWKKIRRGLSAGRVQSVSLRLIVDREREIEKFKPEEYWKIIAALEGQVPPSFKARYTGMGGRKVKVADQETAEGIKKDIESSDLVVSSVERKERRRLALPPFITSRLQQEAARRFRFAAKRTMMVAQQLYEGVDLGEEGTIGLITYMRTDSVRLSAEAVQEARDYIAGQYGKTHLPRKPNTFKSRKSAQDAHEAIRPTSVNLAPSRVGKYLTSDQRKLYKLIWERFVACQMKSAVYDQTTVRILAGSHDLRVSGSVLKFRGWLDAIEDTSSPQNSNGANNDTDGEDESADLPELHEGDKLKLTDSGVSAEQKFTQPPPRFTEGTLIRELEERGIGRPSTYATILSTIQGRRYVTKEKGRFTPSELGALVTDRLVGHFPQILDVDFTASMEESLDLIEEGEQDWIELLNRFYDPFHKDVEKALKEMKHIRDLAEETDEICDSCGKKMVVRWGRNGRFIACSGYPDCRNTKELEQNQTDEIATPIDSKCDTCGKPMIRKRGRYGDFLACSGYPKCEATQSLPTGIPCPKPTCEGELTQRRTKRGRVFYGCSEYKRSGCDFVVWGTPVKESCATCQAAFLIATSQRKGGRTLKCIKDGCGYKRTEDS